jgi:CRP-like cAMP-binding protein
MSSASLESIVAGLPLFEGMKAEHVVLIAECGRNVRFEAGEFIGRQGEHSDRFWVIRDGRVALQMHSPERGDVTVRTVGVNEVLCWSWLVPPHRWHFDALAVTATRAIEFDARCLGGKFRNDYEFGYELFRRFSQVIAERLEATGLQLIDLPGHGD